MTYRAVLIALVALIPGAASLAAQTASAQNVAFANDRAVFSSSPHTDYNSEIAVES